MDKAQKQKIHKAARQANVLEALKDIGAGAKNDIFNQFLGPRPQEKHSGDLALGESLNINEVFTGEYEENKKLKKQITLERRLREEEKVRIERKGNELRVQLQAITQEILALAQTTQNLDESVKIAAIQAPASPGVYHIVFFEKLLEFIKSFRKKIEDSVIWLQTSNKRAQKKNYWAMYKKKGSSFLLAPDHYLQRSAG